MVLFQFNQPHILLHSGALRSTFQCLVVAENGGLDLATTAPFSAFRTPWLDICGRHLAALPQNIFYEASDFGRSFLLLINSPHTLAKSPAW